MLPSDSRERLVLILLGILVIFTPALLVLVMVEFLILSGDLLFSEVTLVEFLELYLLDLLLLVVFGYGIYRLTLWTVEHRLPESIEALEENDSEDDPDEDGGSSRDELP